MYQRPSGSPGRKYGLYQYKSVRMGNSVHTIYLGRFSPDAYSVGADINPTYPRPGQENEARAASQGLGRTFIVPPPQKSEAQAGPVGVSLTRMTLSPRPEDVSLVRGFTNVVRGKTFEGGLRPGQLPTMISQKEQQELQRLSDSKAFSDRYGHIDDWTPINIAMRVQIQNLSQKPNRTAEEEAILKDLRGEYATLKRGKPSSEDMRRLQQLQAKARTVIVGGSKPEPPLFIGFWNVLWGKTYEGRKRPEAPVLAGQRARNAEKQLQKVVDDYQSLVELSDITTSDGKKRGLTKDELKRAQQLYSQIKSYGVITPAPAAKSIFRGRPTIEAAGVLPKGEVAETEEEIPPPPLTPKKTAKIVQPMSPEVEVQLKNLQVEIESQRNYLRDFKKALRLEKQLLTKRQGDIKYFNQQVGTYTSAIKRELEKGNKGKAKIYERKLKGFEERRKVAETYIEDHSGVAEEIARRAEQYQKDINALVLLKKSIKPK